MAKFVVEIEERLWQAVLANAVVGKEHEVLETLLSYTLADVAHADANLIKVVGKVRVTPAS